MMRLILHIGTEKTGTTTLQHWLARHCDVLAGLGLWCCRSLWSPNNRWLALLPLEVASGDDGFEQFGITTQEQWERQRSLVLAELAREVEQARRAGASQFIISSEHAHSRLTHDADVARLHDRLSVLFGAVELVVSFRPVVDLAISKQSTATRAGYPFSFAQMAHEVATEPYFDYAALLTRWRAVFPHAGWHVSAYARQPDAIAMMIGVLSQSAEQRAGSAAGERVLRTLSGLARPERSNMALDERLVRVVTVLNSQGGARLDLADGAMDEWPLERPFTLSRDQATALQDSAAAMIARTCALCPQLRAEELSVDVSRFPERAPQVDQFEPGDAAVLRWLMQRMQHTAWLSAGEASLALAHGAVISGEMDAAQGHLMAAQAQLTRIGAQASTSLEHRLQQALAGHARLAARLAGHEIEPHFDGSVKTRIT